jgi:urease accessory protein
MGMPITTTMITAMATKRLRRAKRSRRGRATVRGAGLRPAPHHEVEVAVARGPLILRSRARRGAKDEAPATGDVNAAALYRLLAWLSPSYPIGAFSYSSGIEWAVEAGDITDADALRGWLAVVIGEGGAFCDAVFLVHAHRAIAGDNKKALREVAELAAAFAPSKERHLETTAQGRAFVEATRAAWPCGALDRLAETWDGPVAYPIAVGVTAAGHGIPLDAALNAYLHAVTANLISAGVRLIPLGQTEGQRLLAALEPVASATAQRALATPLDDVGGAAFRADIASMKHETQYTRLFRT